MSNPIEEQERAAFEAWARKDAPWLDLCWIASPTEPMYASPMTRTALAAWQAAPAQRHADTMPVPLETAAGDQKPNEQTRVVQHSSAVPAAAALTDALRALLADPVIDGMSARIRNAACEDGRPDPLEQARALLQGSQPPAYPLPDDLYDSKDWRAADYPGRVEWLHTMYENKKREVDELLAQAPAVQQGEALPELYISGPYTCGKNEGRRSVCDLATGRVLGYLSDGVKAIDGGQQ